MNTDHPRPFNGVEHQIEHARIARRAYELYEARGCQSGHADEDWLLAEMDLRSREGSPRTSSSEQSGRGRGFTEADRVSESETNKAEQLRRLAEAAREVRDRHRDALETVRQEQERLRNVGETTRAVGEEARAVAEAARQAVVDAMRATADTFRANLEQMKLVEEMRRALRDMRDVDTLDSN